MTKKLFLLPFLWLFAFVAFAQDVPVQQGDKDSYNFSINPFVVVKDFKFVSAVPAEKPNHYEVIIKALDEQGKLDQSISGTILFEANGKMAPVDFQEGTGYAVVELPEGAEEFVFRSIDSDVTRTARIKSESTFRWFWAFMLIPGLIILYLIFARIKKNREKKAE